MKKIGTLLGMDVIEVDDLPNPGPIILGSGIRLVAHLTPTRPRPGPDGETIFGFRLEPGPWRLEVIP